VSDTVVEPGVDRRREHWLTPWWRKVAAIIAVGFVVRVAFIWFVARGDGPLGDQLFYSAQAIKNSQGGWFEQPFAPGEPAADHPPLTAFVLTPVTWMFEWTGSVVTIQRLFTAMVGALSIVLMALLGRQVGGPRVGLIAAGLTAVYANVWLNDGLIMAEAFTFALTVLLTMAVLRQLDAPSRRGSAVIGVLLGLLALTRPEFVLVGVLLAGLFALLPRGAPAWRERLVQISVVAVVAIATIAPWVIWNQVRFDGPVTISTNDGLTIAGANCDRTYFEDVGGWDIWCAYETEIPEGFDNAQASALMRADGLAYWREHIDRYPVVAAARVARVLSVGYIGATAEAGTSEGRPVWASHLGMVQYWLLIPFAVIGFRRRATTEQRIVLLGCIPIVLAVALVANAYVRFRVPAEVGLVVLAALGIDVVIARVQARRESF
jgi:4-amino-4-deoxy-L-arabinose transferase-like glycosyltransferase